MKIAVFPGTFDPITAGHVDVIAKASRLFDSLNVAILHNPNKSPLFSIEERMELIRAVVEPFGNVQVQSFTGLLVDFVRHANAVAVVRGLRDEADFPLEFRMAQMNWHLYPQATTVFIPTNPEHSFISSTFVKEIARLGGEIEHLVPSAVQAALRMKFPGAATT